VSVATADTMLACWEAKYHYYFWRPNHAIQPADTDGRDRVAPQLLRDEACEARDLQHRGRPAPPRTYESLDELVTDVENARVWGGLHYRTTMTKTAKHFPQIARDVGRKYFLTDAGRKGDRHND
jgi:hypothetical protein